MAIEYIIVGAIGLGVLYMISQQPAPAAVVAPKAPPAVVAPETVVGVPTPYPVPTPTPTPAPEEPAPEEPYTPPEGPDFYTSYTIGETWMLNYFHNVDPGPIDADCSMSFVRYDTLRSPYSWSFTFDYICLHNGTGTYRRTVNVIAGTPSMGY